MSDIAAGAFHRRRDGCVEIAVRLTPKSSRDALEGVETQADGRACLKARVRAVPEKGKANTALERLLAAALNVPRGSVAVVGGATARLKTVRIDGEPDGIEKTLARLASPDRP